MRGNICFGLTRLPLETTDDRDRLYDELSQVIGKTLSQGYRDFNAYFPSRTPVGEDALKEVLTSRIDRNAITLGDEVTVLRFTTPEDPVSFLEEQCRHLGVSYLDYYTLRDITRQSYHEIVLKKDLLRRYLDLKQHGRIRRLGIRIVSDGRLLEQILSDFPQLDYVQMPMRFSSRKQESEIQVCYDIARSHHKLVIADDPFDGGNLLKKSPEGEEKLRAMKTSSVGLALAYSLRLDGVLMVRTDVASLEELDDTLEAVKDLNPWDEKQEALLKDSMTGVTVG